MKSELRSGISKVWTLCLLLFFAVSCIGSGNYEIIISHHQPDKTLPGETIFCPLDYPSTLISADMSGNILWKFSSQTCGTFWDFEVLENPDELELLFACTNGKAGYLRPYSNELTWIHNLPGFHHSALMLPWGKVLYVASRRIYRDPWPEPLLSDAIKEIDPDTGEILWEWNLDEYIDPIDHHCPVEMAEVDQSGARDWAHSNSLHYYPDPVMENEGSILMNIRNLNTILLIHYPSGEILWSLGEAGTFGAGLFYHAHDAELWPNTQGPGYHIVMFDNDQHNPAHPLNELQTRALNLLVDPATETAEVFWEWGEQGLWAPIRGDANLMPNGNYLVTDSYRGRLIEVTPDKEKAWELLLQHPIPHVFYSFYKSERIPF